MSRVRALVVAAVLLALVVGLGWWWSGRQDGTGAGGSAERALAEAPLGLEIYAPTAEQVLDGEHGSVIWARRSVESGGSGSGPRSTTYLVVYRSVGAKGEPVAVSGSVTIPTGQPPVGGWPVLSWGHGTTGLADRCAPSRGLLPGQTNLYAGAMDRLTAQYVARGYAVARTDYEGLGTPGPHPYLLGESAGRAMTDIVLAARELDEDVSGRWLAAGHSQGAQAALFTTLVPGGYARGLELAGVVALAPPSQLATVLDMTARGDMSSVFLGPLLASAAHVADVPSEQVFSRRGRDLLPHLEERCITDLGADDSFGGLTTRRLLRDDADLAPLRRVVAANDAVSLTPRVPVLLVHGTRDEIVPSLLSDNLAEQYEAKGVDLTYEQVTGANHVDVLAESRPVVDSWLTERLPSGK